MEFILFRDPLAVRFIRCVSPVPGTVLYAGGAGITLAQAMARCESEVVERDFELNYLQPKGLIPVGIAAHPNAAAAKERALQEAVETRCLEKIQQDGQMACVFKFKFFGLSLGMARTSYGYFGFLTGIQNGIPIAAYSARATFWGTLLKTWEEFQSIRFFQPQGKALKTFTKAHKIFSANDLLKLRLIHNPKIAYKPNLSDLSLETLIQGDRVIAYLLGGQVV